MLSIAWIRENKNMSMSHVPCHGRAVQCRIRAVSDVVPVSWPSRATIVPCRGVPWPWRAMISRAVPCRSVLDFPVPSRATKRRGNVSVPCQNLHPLCVSFLPMCGAAGPAGEADRQTGRAGRTG